MARMGLSACVALLVACGGGATNANASINDTTNAQVTATHDVTITTSDLTVGTNQQVDEWRRDPSRSPGFLDFGGDGGSSTNKMARNIFWEARVVMLGEPNPWLEVDGAGNITKLVNVTVDDGTHTFVNTVLETGHKDIDFPTVKSTVRIEALGVTPSGELVVQSDNVDISILDDVVDPRVRAMMAKQAQHMKGTRTSWRMKRGGDISDMQVTPATAFPVESYGESVRFFTPRFPDVPIGIGSEWRLQRQVTSSRIKWNVSATYRLREVDDTRAILDVDLDMKAGEQALSVEPNATTTLKSATGHVTGTVTVPLHGLAFEGEGHVTTETRFLIVQGHLRITSTVESATLMTSKPVHM